MFLHFVSTLSTLKAFKWALNLLFGVPMITNRGWGDSYSHCMQACQLGTRISFLKNILLLLLNLSILYTDNHRNSSLYITQILTSNIVVTMLTWEDRCEAIYCVVREIKLCGLNTQVFQCWHYLTSAFSGGRIDTSHHITDTIQHETILQRNLLLHLLILNLLYNSIS